MITLTLTGYLNKLIPDPVKIEASTMFEAISFLSSLPALKKGHSFHQVMIEGFTTKEALSMEIHSDIEVTINPVFTGAGSNGARVIIGIVIIVVALYFKVNIANVLGANMGAVAVNFAIGMGMNLILGGISGMLNKPSPNATNSRAERNNLLSADQNTAQIGTRIPIIYGKRKWYGQFISVDVDSSDYNPRDLNPDGSANLNFNYSSLQDGLYDDQIPIISSKTPPPVLLTYWVASEVMAFPAVPTQTFVKSSGFSGVGDVEIIIFGQDSLMGSTVPKRITIAPKDGIVRSTNLDILDISWRTSKILNLIESAEIVKITAVSAYVHKIEIFDPATLVTRECIVELPYGSNPIRTWETIGRYGSNHLLKTSSTSDSHMVILPATGTVTLVTSNAALIPELPLEHTCQFGSIGELQNGATVVTQYSRNFDDKKDYTVIYPVELGSSDYSRHITSCNGEDLCMVTVKALPSGSWSASYVCQMKEVINGSYKTYQLTLVGREVRGTPEAVASVANTRGFWRGNRIINSHYFSGISSIFKHTTTV